MSITFTNLPDESSWTYRAGVGWLVVAGVAVTIASICAATIFLLPAAVLIAAVFVIPALAFAHSFLTYRSVFGAATATVVVTVLVAAEALYGYPGPALVLTPVAGLSALGLAEILIQRRSRPPRPAHQPAMIP